MPTTTLIARGDIMSASMLFPANLPHEKPLSSKCHVWLIGRSRARVLERLTFLIDGFDPRMNYFIDFGDGNCRRILGRKFHYQFEREGFFRMMLSIREGEQMLPICTHDLQIEDHSWKAALRSLNLF